MSAARQAAWILPAALLLAACGNSRNEAAAELLRLDAAMQQHRTSHGRYPETIDPARPATPANLPFAPERKMTVRLRAVAGDRYQATARHRSWNCWMAVGPDQPALPDCAPLTASAPEDTPEAVGQAPPATPGLTAADSTPDGNARP